MNAAPNEILNVRRTADDAERPIPTLANGELDVDEMLNFAPGSTMKATILRGQLNGCDIFQHEADLQRAIVDSGTVMTYGGKPCLYAAAGTGMMGSIPAYAGSTASLFISGHSDVNPLELSDVIVALTKDEEGAGVYPGHAYVARRAYQEHVTVNRNYGQSADGPSTGDFLLSVIWDGVNTTMRDGVNSYTWNSGGNFDINTILLGMESINFPISETGGRFSEMALWTTDQTANEAAIRGALTT